MATPTILLTNDDGIDSVGFTRLYTALDEVADVVAVAPATNRSAVGRSIASDARVEEHELGYALHGTPASCVVAGVTALEVDPDLVVSGINKGANLGRPILGRSGTVAAAIEAAYMDLPAIAVSMYIPFDRIEGDFHEHEPDGAKFSIATETIQALIERHFERSLFAGIDYLNVNTPEAGSDQDPTLRVTRPAEGYYTIAEPEGDRLAFRDRQFEMLYTGELEDGHDTDRQAIAEGDVSISPLSLPARSVPRAVRERLSEAVSGRVAPDSGSD